MSSSTNKEVSDFSISQSRPRRTLARPSRQIDGIGLHSGMSVSLQFLPAASESGIIIHNAEHNQDIQAIAANVNDTTRCTQLAYNGVIVQTVEHVLSAISACGVDDIIVKITSREMPAVDGSALAFAELLSESGIIEHGGCIQALVVKEPVAVDDGRGGSIRIEPSDHLTIEMELDYPNHPYIGTQSAQFDSLTDNYVTEIAPARTFGFLKEIEYLHSKGLGLGASYDNALVLGEDSYVTEPRFINEMARHKILDIIGDLALIGRPIIGKISAAKPGHALNCAMAHKLTNM